MMSSTSYQRKVDYKSTNNNFSNHNTGAVPEKEVPPKAVPAGLDSSVSDKYKKKLLVFDTLSEYQKEKVMVEVAKHSHRASVN